MSMLEFALVLGALSTILSTAAAFVALSARQIRMTPRREFDAMQLRLDDLQDRLEQVLEVNAKIVQRQRMRTQREKKNGADHSADPLTQRSDESISEWKARCRQILANRTVRQ